MKEKIAVWGTGMRAMKFLFFNKDKFEVVRFFDNDERKHNT